MNQKFRRLFITLCSILSIGSLNLGNVATAAKPTSDGITKGAHYNLKNQLAIKGYDPVAYFTKTKAIKGIPKFTYQHYSVKYQFSSHEHLMKFKSNPNQYEPQYGGWCAYAFAVDGGKVSINPRRFKIIDNKLYLFYDTLLGPNTLKKWNKANDTEQIIKANKRWAVISK